jgi:hypothetical protein
MKMTVLATLLVGALGADARPETTGPACWVRGSRDGLAARPSRLDSTSVTLGGREVKVCYGAPKKNGRQVAGGLIPFDKPWRIGANEATVIYMPAKGSIAGVAVQPGWYSLYTYAGPTEWRIHVNAAVQRWGVPEAVPGDVGTGTARVENVDTAEETLRLRLASTGAGSADLVVHWDKTRVRIPIVLAPRGI